MAGGLRQVNYGRRITAVCVWQGVEDGSEAETANWEGRHGRRRQQKAGGEGGGEGGEGGGGDKRCGIGGIGNHQQHRWPIGGTFHA